MWTAPFLILAIPCLSVLLVACTVEQDPERFVTSVDEINVYEAVFSEYMITSADGKTRRLWLSDRTEGHIHGESFAEVIEKLVPEFPGVPEDTWINFLQRNRLPARIPLDILVTGIDGVVAAETLDSLFAREPYPWEVFRLRFPESLGFARSAQVGFSEDGQHAIIYVGVYCGIDCGFGPFSHLKRTDSGWKVESSVLAWRS